MMNAIKCFQKISKIHRIDNYYQVLLYIFPYLQKGNVVHYNLFRNPHWLENDMGKSIQEWTK